MKVITHRRYEENNKGKKCSNPKSNSNALEELVKFRSI
jgi:hypothetical protein